MSNNKILTISIGAYNAQEFLPECLDSLSKIDKETRDRIEIIVTNDGSTDSTLEIINKWKLGYDGDVIVVDQTNRGLGSTFNNGIERGNGKYWLSLDADDTLDKTGIENLIESLHQMNSDIIVFRMHYFGFRDRNDAKFSQDICKEMEIKDINNEDMLFIHNSVYKLDMLKSLKIKADEQYRLYNDAVLLTRIFLNASTISFSNEIAYNYRVSSQQSVSWRSVLKHRDDLVSMTESLLDTYQSGKVKYDEKKSRYLERILVTQISTLYYSSLLTDETRKIICDLNYRIDQYKELIRKLPWQVKLIKTNNPVFFKPMKFAYIFYKEKLQFG